MANTKITSNVIADNAVGITQLNVSDGSDGQALVTNGAGTLSFSTISSGLPLSGGTLTGNLTMGGMILKPSADGGSIGLNRNPDNGNHVGDSSLRRFQINGPDSTGGDFIQIQSYNSSGTHQGNVNIQDGKIGIGVTPDELLVVDGDIKIRSTNKLHFTNTSDQTSIHAPASNTIAISTNSSERMRIASDGDVGIGTNSPSSKLSVKADQENLIDLQRTTTTTGAAYIKYTNDGGNYYIGADSSAGNRIAVGGQAYALTLTTESSRPIVFATNNTARMHVSETGIITKPYQPAFHAYGATSATSGADVIYANTYVNTGGHYSTTNGRFTAPVAGVYVFFWSAIGNNNNDVYRYFLHKNGSKNIANSGNDIHLRMDTLATGSEYATNGSRVQMLALAANDYIQIYFQADSSNSTYVGSQDDYMNFGGFLIG